MSSYYIWTIGCQMNVSDSQRLANALEDLGHRPALRMEDADVMILNTCVVRQSAENKVTGRLSSLKSAKRDRPDSLLAVLGCFVGQLANHEQLHKDYPYVDMWLGPSETGPILAFLAQNNARQAGQLQASRAGRSSICAYTTIIHGCNNFCSYCIVPYRRGAEASRPITDIVDEIKEMVKGGTREITLLGQNVDSYGRDIPGHPTLPDLLKAVHEIEDLWRIRFLTSHPKDMSPQLIRTAAALPKVCEHIELPFQAGDDRVLERMNRHYTIERYRTLIRQIRAAMPVVSLATDVIVGFPGETDAQFDRTYALLEEIRFDAVHVAAYSPRSGTLAADWQDDVPAETKENRRKAVETLQERVASEINAELLEQTLEVLVETRHKGKWRGRTRTNKLVFFSDPRDWLGQLAPVRITWAGPWSMQGTVDD